mmetsp:Transcript_21272/g.60576  ORF Transcript_21272/g.60576 Transcript_21272/m.60576 type:complete len:240 (+) Transcript_21272:775-1494(+)
MYFSTSTWSLSAAQCRSGWVSGSFAARTEKFRSTLYSPSSSWSSGKLPLRTANSSLRCLASSADSCGIVGKLIAGPAPPAPPPPCICAITALVMSACFFSNTARSSGVICASLASIMACMREACASASRFCSPVRLAYRFCRAASCGIGRSCTPSPASRSSSAGSLAALRAAICASRRVVGSLAPGEGGAAAGGVGVPLRAARSSLLLLLLLLLPRRLFSIEIGSGLPDSCTSSMPTLS